MQIFSFRNARLLPFFITIPYFIFVFLLLNPAIQRNAFYAHRVNPTLWQSLDNVEQFGFHSAQVQPFTYSPEHEPDVELYAWHILPLTVYLEHEASLKSSQNSTHPNAAIPYQTFSSSSSFRLLLNSPTAHLIINLHGNAAHLASSHRPTMIQHLLGLSTPDRPIHVITIDYRGFGLSTGTPTETGLTADVLSLLKLLEIADFPMSRVTLLGTSLGSAVATSTLHSWAITLKQPSLPSLILITSFSSVPTLLESYSLKGIVPPLLSGLDYFPPFVKNFVTSRIRDPWPTATRLRDLWVNSHITASSHMDISIFHAEDDHEIPWPEGWRNFIGMTETGIGTIIPKTDAFPVPPRWWHVVPRGEICWWGVKVETQDGTKRLSWDLVKHGGHNRIAVGEQMRAVVWKSLERATRRG